MSKTIVMCPPFYYDVKYELNTNRWMDKNVRPDKRRARRQWLKLYEGCLRHGLKVLLAPVWPGLPDMTFVANAGVSLKQNNIFIISNYFHEERRPESNCHQPFFSSIFGNFIDIGTRALNTNDNEFFEGQGDAIWLDDKRLLVGYGVRTNLEGVEALERTLKKYDPEVEVIGLPMRPLVKYPKNREVFYHLDTCLCWLPQAQTFLAYEYPFLSEAREKLRQLGKVMPVNRAEANKFVCNAVVVDEYTVFLPWINERIKAKLMALGYRRFETFPMSEFMKSGGAVKCLILEL